jgi:periplasmic protein TonB
MFESVVPETFQTRSKRLFYETLPVSIALHAIVIAGVLATTLWRVVFPEQSPRAVRSYILAALPDPPPPPPPPPAAAPVPQPKAPVAQVPPELKLLAPTKIPDLIPTVVEPPPLPIPPPPVAVAPEPARQTGGETGGEIGGKLGGHGGGIAWPDDGRIHIERNQTLPLAVIKQDYPAYPDSAKKAQLEDQVIVRYVIGKDGRVGDIQIVSHANNPVFDESVLDAIRKWRFRPMVKEGKTVEVVHELAINFELIRH